METAPTEPFIGSNGSAKTMDNGHLLNLPEIPHITTNMIPLSSILENISSETFKRLKEFFKYLESSNEMDVLRKRHFLELLVSFRENFVRLYVLCKWTQNADSISKLINLFVWLREQNQFITNTIMSFGGVKPSLISAKMPEPDLSTSLEVLLQGRPTLPHYNFLDEKYNKLSPKFVLKILQNLNVELSVKMSLQERVPKHFRHYTIKDGCIHFDVNNYFTCSLSMLSDSKLHLIDFKLGFALVGQMIKPSIKKLNSKSFLQVQRVANSLLDENSPECLEKLFGFLYNISVTNKIMLMHKQLVNLRMGIWRGHLTHQYNPETSIITINYWMKNKSIKASSIQIGKFESDEKISMKWFKNGELCEVHNICILDENDNIDLLNCIYMIIRVHVKDLILQLKQKLIETVENIERMIVLSNNNEKLVFKITNSKELIYGIDLLSGLVFFENPSNLFNRAAFNINSGKGTDFIEILRLKMLIQENEMNSMMNATGWVNLSSIELSNEEVLKLNITNSKLKSNNNSLKSILTSIKVYRRKDWPIGWTILLSNCGFQSNVQLWCSKIQSTQGQWIINWINEININELNDNPSNGLFSDSGPVGEEEANTSLLTYENLINLIKISSSKLISNLIVKELKDEGCELKILNSSDKKVNDFISKNFDIDNLSPTSTENAVLLIQSKSLFHIDNAKDSLVLLITIKNSDLNAKIYGKLLNDNSIKNLPNINYGDLNTKLDYDSSTRIFKIESNVDLSHQFNQPDSSLSLLASSSTKKNHLILSNILIFLKKFSKLLNLLKLINTNEALDILQILPDGVVFKYGANNEEYITLRINFEENVLIELPSDNPHYFCLPYLNEIIANDQVNVNSIKDLVLYLRMTLKFCRRVQKLINSSELNLEEFNAKNENIDYERNAENFQIMPASGYLTFFSNLENLRISYFKNVKVEVQNTNNKNKKLKTVSDIFKFEIKVELRHRIKKISSKNSLFFISLGAVRSDYAGIIKTSDSITNAIAEAKELLSVFNEVGKFLGSYFSGENFPIKIENEGSVIFLKDSICCDCESVDVILEDLHKRLLVILRQ